MAAFIEIKHENNLMLINVNLILLVEAGECEEGEDCPTVLSVQDSTYYLEESYANFVFRLKQICQISQICD